MRLSVKALEISEYWDLIYFELMMFDLSDMVIFDYFSVSVNYNMRSRHLRDLKILRFC